MARRGPVGKGYMPKGGVKAAQAHNRPFEETFASEHNADAARVDSGLGTASKVALRPVGGAVVLGNQGARQRAAVLLSTPVLARVGAVAGVWALVLELVHH